jgi:hypothetical protein
MPVTKCESNGKWRIGSGECKYDTKEKAVEVWKAILAQGKYKKDERKQQQDNLREKKKG